MLYRLLGPVEARGSGGAVDLRAARRRTLLALLLVRRNQTVPVDTIIDELWPAAAPPGAQHTVQAYVSELRAALSRAETGNGPLRTAAPGYVLDVGPDDCDEDRLRRLLRDAATSPPEHAVVLLENALALWSGSALAGVEGPVLDAEARRLAELRLSTVEDLLDARLALGRHVDVVRDAQLLADEHPLRERLQAQLALALYRSGRQSEALSVLARTRTTSSGSTPPAS